MTQTLRAQLWALVAPEGPTLSAEQIAFIRDSNPPWAFQDVLLIASIEKALKADK